MSCDCPACDSAISDLQTQVCQFEGTAQVLGSRLARLKDQVHLRFEQLNERIVALRGDNDALRSTLQQLVFSHALQTGKMEADDVGQPDEQQLLPIFTSEMLREAGIDCAECAKLINEMSMTSATGQRLPVRPTAILPTADVQAPVQQLSAPSVLQLSSILTPSPSPHRDAYVTSPTSTIDSCGKAERARSKLAASSSKLSNANTTTCSDLLETPTSSASRSDTDKCRTEQEYVNQAVISEFVRKRNLAKKPIGVLPAGQNEKRLGTVMTPSPAVSHEKIAVCNVNASSSLPRTAMRPPLAMRHTSESPQCVRKAGNSATEQCAVDVRKRANLTDLNTCGKLCDAGDCLMNICDRFLLSNHNVVFLMVDDRALLYSSSADNFVLRNLQQLLSAVTPDENGNSHQHTCLCADQSARKSDVDDLPQPSDELLMHGRVNESGNLPDRHGCVRKTVRIADTNNSNNNVVANCVRSGYLFQLEPVCPQASLASKNKAPHWHKYWFVLRDNLLFAYNAVVDTRNLTQLAAQSPSSCVTLDADTHVQMLYKDSRRVLHLLHDGSKHTYLSDAPLNDHSQSQSDCNHCVSLSDWHLAVLKAVRSRKAQRTFAQLNKFRSDSAVRNVRHTPIRVCGSELFSAHDLLHAFLLDRYLFLCTHVSQDVTNSLADCEDLTQLELLCSDQFSIAFWRRANQSTFLVLFERRDENFAADWCRYVGNYSSKFVQPEVLTMETMESTSGSSLRETSVSPQRKSSGSGSGSGSATAIGTASALIANASSSSSRDGESERVETVRKPTHSHSANWQQASVCNSQSGGNAVRCKPTLEDQFLLGVLNEPHLFDTLSINTLDYAQTVRQQHLELSNLLDLLLCAASSAERNGNGNVGLLHIAPSRKSVCLLRRLCTLCFEHPFLVDSLYQELVRCTATEFCTASGLARSCAEQPSVRLKRPLINESKRDQRERKNAPKPSASASSLLAKLCSTSSSGCHGDQASVSPPRASCELADVSLLVTRSWQLLALLTSVFAPRNRLLQRAVWIHLRRNANTATESGRYAQFCLKALRRTYGQTLECVYEPQTPPMCAHNSLQRPNQFRSPSVQRNPCTAQCAGNLRAQNSCTSLRNADRKSDKDVYETTRLKDSQLQNRRYDTCRTAARCRAQVPSSMEIRSLLLCNPLTYTTPLTVTVLFAAHADSLLSVALPVSKGIGFDSFTTVGDICNALERSLQLRPSSKSGLSLSCTLPNGDRHVLPQDYILADVFSRLEQLSECSETASMCTSMTQSQASVPYANETLSTTLQCGLTVFKCENWQEQQVSENERLIVLESVIDSVLACPVRCCTFAVLSSLIGKYTRVVCSLALAQSRLDIQRVYACCKCLLGRIRDAGLLHGHELSFLRKCINDVLSSVISTRDARHLPSVALDDMMATVIQWPVLTAQWFPVSNVRFLLPEHSSPCVGVSEAHLSVCCQGLALWSRTEVDGNANAKPLFACCSKQITAFGKCRIPLDVHSNNTLQEQTDSDCRTQLFLALRSTNEYGTNNMSISTYDNGSSNYTLAQACNSNYGQHSCYPQAIVDVDNNGTFYVVLTMATGHDASRALNIIQCYAETSTWTSAFGDSS